ncbi:MAG: hypothetical protein EZS28_044212 [Streblomastix strix]|uniref:Uncharacterized protein n=1 Tax=Streblomastix strix TaxID=222440 RepID=A0A5J4TS21_9EUKA|nr:MAG: hypothetical protein EZS28_044212 [Streblomastix strix]
MLKTEDDDDFDIEGNEFTKNINTDTNSEVKKLKRIPNGEGDLQDDFLTVARGDNVNKPLKLYSGKDGIVTEEELKLRKKRRKKKNTDAQKISSQDLEKWRNELKGITDEELERRFKEGRNKQQNQDDQFDDDLFELEDDDVFGVIREKEKEEQDDEEEDEEESEFDDEDEDDEELIKQIKQSHKKNKSGKEINKDDNSLEQRIAQVLAEEFDDDHIGELQEERRNISKGGRDLREFADILTEFEQEYILPLDKKYV